MRLGPLGDGDGIPPEAPGSGSGRAFSAVGRRSGAAGSAGEVPVVGDAGIARSVHARGYLSAERFHAQLPLLLPYAVSHVRGWRPEWGRCWGISPRQIGRSLASLRRAHVVPALDEIAGRLPFAVYAVHSDNGNEFINHHLVRWCAKRNVDMTRGRPNRKNDNARIKQKNWIQVRQVIGYRRHETVAELRQMRRIYATLEVLASLFEPSAKLLSKQRDGAQVKRRYDRPATPLDRLIAYYRERGKPLPEAVVEQIQLRRQSDPLALYERLRDEVGQLHALRRKAA